MASGGLTGIRTTAKISGLEEMAKNIDKLSRVMQGKAIEEALKAAAKPVLKAAVAKVPVDRGVLRDSLDIDDPVNEGNGTYSIRVLARYSLGGYHANLIEFGTSRFAAQPFLRPALSTTRGKQRDAMIGEVNKATRKVL